MSVLQSGDDMMIVFLVNCCSQRLIEHALIVKKPLSSSLWTSNNTSRQHPLYGHICDSLSSMGEINNDRTTQFLASTFTLLAISWLVYFCRLYTRLYLVKQWFLEDYFITIGMVSFRQL
jgi:hypothetical protein